MILCIKISICLCYFFFEYNSFTISFWVISLVQRKSNNYSTTSEAGLEKLDE